jgi:sugar/nucleoside kinase (ribokinase family)
LLREVQNSEYVYAEGFFLSTNKDAFLKAALQIHNSQDQYFGFNLSAIFLINQYKDEIGEILRLADYVFGNEDEFIHLGKIFSLTNSFDDSPETYYKICE